MRSTSSTLFIMAAIAAAGLVASAGGAVAQTAMTTAAHEIPQSQIIEHQQNLTRLKELSARPGKVGEVAREAVTLFKKHDSREAEYIMPPLSLLPYLADGKVTPDMQWAVDMADRVKADREVIFQEHTEMIDLLNRLRLAAVEAHDADAADFAQDAATDALNDVEMLEPMAVVIGDYVRGKLAAAH